MTPRLTLVYDSRLDPCPRCGAWLWEYPELGGADDAAIVCGECNAQTSTGDVVCAECTAALSLVGQD